MKRTHLAALLVGISGFLLFVQIFILQILTGKDDETTEPDPVWDAIHTVINAGTKHGFPLFLIDPIILDNVKNMSKVSRNTRCRLLCMGQKATHLGTLGQLSTQTQKERFIEELEKVGTKVMMFEGNNPVLIRHELKVQISLHYILILNNHAVHIVVFYDRGNQYWWHGPLHLIGSVSKDIEKFGIKNSRFSQQAGIYEKVEINPVVIDNIKLLLPAKFPFILPESSTKFIECNYIRSKLFYEKYGRDESEEAELFRTKAWKLLAKAKNLLDHLNIPFWLSSGTCLGYFRQCDFIPYSKDVDIGIWINDFKSDILPAFSTHDLPLTHSFGKIEDSFELSFRDEGTKLDVFFFYEEKDHVWNGGTQSRTGKKFKYIFPKFELCWTEFLELKVRVPCQTEDYIRANYGPNWFEPVKVWDWKNSPPNVEENGQWPIEEWPDVIQLIPIPEQT